MAPSRSPLSDEGEVRTAAIEYVVRTVVKPSPDLVLFVSLPADERRSLANCLQGWKVKAAQDARFSERSQPEDASSGERGVILEVKRIRLSGRFASVCVGFFSGAGVTFDLQLEKTDAWKVTGKSEPTIAE
jgi:hypothetical protein